MSTTEYRVVIILDDGRRQSCAETHTQHAYARAQADQMPGLHTEIQQRTITPWRAAN